MLEPIVVVGFNRFGLPMATFDVGHWRNGSRLKWARQGPNGLFWRACRPLQVCQLLLNRILCVGPLDVLRRKFAKYRSDSYKYDTVVSCDSKRDVIGGLG